MRPDTVAVICIVLLALGYFLLRARRSLRKGSSCGCGSGCGACPSSQPKGASCASCGHSDIAPCPPPGRPL